jgi:phage shock protein E
MPNPETLYLDVRSPEEFQQHKLSHSLNIPVDDLARRLAEVGDFEQPIVVYCRSGRRSAIAARILQRAGFARVTDAGSIDRVRGT